MTPVAMRLPRRLLTERPILRCPHEDDAAASNEAVAESIDSLRPWMPWAQAVPTLEQAEAEMRRMHARFLLREDLVLLMFERLAGGGEGLLVGGTGLHRIDWDVRRFEIGYWRRASAPGRGFVHEAVTALTRFAFDALAAQRVEIRMDEANRPSRRVAERAGFVLEGVLRRDSTTPHGEPRDTRVYAQVRGIEEA